MKVLEKCNHPECIDGVMHESVGSITVMRKCEYCRHDKQPENWRESKTAKRLKAFIDLNNKVERESLNVKTNSKSYS